MPKNERADEPVHVPAAGGDPDSVQRVAKTIDGMTGVDKPSGLGADTPEELAAQRAAHGVQVNTERNRAVVPQPPGDGKETGAPSADDPGSGLREGRLTPGEDLEGKRDEVEQRDEEEAARREAADKAAAAEAEKQAAAERAETDKAAAAERRAAAGESRVSTPQGRATPAKSTTAAKSTGTTSAK